jgi:hypothetical protein
MLVAQLRFHMSWPLHPRVHMDHAQLFAIQTTAALLNSNLDAVLSNGHQRPPATRYYPFSEAAAATSRIAA